MPDGVESPNTADDDFRLLMERVRAGCPDAAREVYDRYGDGIRRVVRRQLHQRLRTRYDSLDFLQDVWLSFFRTSADKYTFDDPQSLIDFLASLAYAKVTGAFRQNFQTQKRNVNREQAREGAGHDLEPGMTPMRGPTPSQEAIANEHWQRMLAGQSESCRLLLEMLRQGHSRAEIAERTGLHPKVIQRFLVQMAQRRDIQ